MRSLGDSLRGLADLLVTDLDGTILDEDHERATPTELWTAIEVFQRAGGRWWVATGRSLADALDAVANAGARTSPDGVVAVEKLIHHRRVDVFIEDTSWNDVCRRALARLFARNAARVHALRARLDLEYEGRRYEDALSPLCIEARSPEELACIHAAVIREVNAMGAVFTRNDRYGRVTHGAWHKGSAMRHVQRRGGLLPERTIAVGNDLNDLSMLDPHVAAMIAAPEDSARAVLDRVRRQGGEVGCPGGPRGALSALQAIGRRHAHEGLEGAVLRSRG